jgi:DNA-binding transcriptional LysR family regulator
MVTGTATGAASILNVTQPAVSHTISEMEAITGLTLFDRRGGRIVATSHARLLFEEIERSFLGLTHIDTFCDRLRNSVGHSIVVAAPSGVCLTLLPRAIASYQKSIAQDFFAVYARPTDQAISWICTQKADLGFGWRSKGMPGISCERISTFEALCAIPAGHPLCSKQSITVTELHNAAFIGLSPNEGLRQTFDGQLTDSGVLLKEVVESPMGSAACAMVEAGVGIALVDHLAAFMFRKSSVAFRRFEPPIPMSFFCYWLSDRKPHYKRDALIERIKKIALELEANLTKMLD